MAKASGRTRQERGLVDKTVHPDPDVWSFDPDEAEEYEDVIAVAPDAKIIQRYNYVRGKIVEFALIQQQRHEGEWCDVAKVDTDHSEVHLHRYDVQGNQFDRRVLRPIKCQADVDEGLVVADQVIFDLWEENRRRWENGR